MMKSQEEEKKAVDCGYWQLYRYNPTAIDEGKNPFTLDSKEPTGDYKEFLLGETRYASLMKARPELAQKLFEKTEKDSKDRIATYKHLADK
jgi:pyruvate-ferredoxin/flavodoxin oxidoreductase